MELANLIKELGTFGPLLIGAGPKHPISPNASIQPEIDAFFTQNPLLAHDVGYVEFLETYAAAAIYRPDETLLFEIYGFVPEIAISLSSPNESLIEQERYFRFAEIGLNSPPQKGGFTGISFAFDLASSEQADIHMQITLPGKDFQTINYDKYCSNFIEWLGKIVRFGSLGFPIENL